MRTNEHLETAHIRVEEFLRIVTTGSIEWRGNRDIWIIRVYQSLHPWPTQILLTNGAHVRPISFALLYVSDSIHQVAFCPEKRTKGKRSEQLASIISNRGVQMLVLAPEVGSGLSKRNQEGRHRHPQVPPARLRNHGSQLGVAQAGEGAARAEQQEGNYQRRAGAHANHVSRRVHLPCRCRSGVAAAVVRKFTVATPQRRATASCARCRSGRNALKPNAPRRLDRSRPGGFDRNPWFRSLGSWPRRCLGIVGEAALRRRCVSLVLPIVGDVHKTRRPAGHAAAR